MDAQAAWQQQYRISRKRVTQLYMTPRAGERRQRQFDGVEVFRITPACGGETEVRPQNRILALPDHPRVRGRDAQL